MILRMLIFKIKKKSKKRKTFRVSIAFVLLCKTMALTLIILLHSVVSQTLSSESDKVALLALKQKLTNGEPNALPSWNESLHLCEWQGVVLHLENQN